MNQRGVAVGVGAGATLLLAAWVSAAGPVGVFARKDFSGKESGTPGKDFGDVTAPPRSGNGLKGADVRHADPWTVTLVELALKLLLVVVVVIVLVAIGRALLDRWRAREVTADQEAAVDVVPEVLLEAALEGERQLSRGTPANAVIAAWVALEDACRAAGVRDDDSRTAAELLTAVLRSHRVDRAPLDTLAALYREARFSTHPIGEDQRTTAREALVQVQSDLRRTMARLAPERTVSR
ncbi:DUF4129 domain-containing protein [Phycicoccus sp. Soil803]|uniref:DUF4129 domain-containing protein n=1 Tax=Phycicoccus sp. Soil803 TaxID=1736415 RepID=UPI00070D1D26|nr:DUF4129 domain-containing protein [Phycicoccus sp. Soil803]KRF24465.1 hypothetical protein ASG95_07970 [Phycicoccus sp. Soil803]